MTRTEFLKKYTARFLVALLLVGLILYTFYHVQGASAADLMTVPTREVTDLRMTSGTAYLFRDERVLSVDSSDGVVDDLVKSGTKVSKNQALAEVYTGYRSLERVSIQLELDRLNRMIAVLENSRLTEGSSLSLAEKYREAAGEQYLEIKEAILSGQWNGISTDTDRMLALLNRYNLLTGRLEHPDLLLAELKAEKAALLTAARTTVYNTDASGFFFNRDRVDGYESLYTMERLETLTTESLDELKALSPVKDENATTVGKMVYGYTWYLAVEMTGSATDFCVGDSYEIRFSQGESRSLSMTCERLVEGSDGRFIAIFSSSDLPADFSYTRIQSVEIVVGSSVGYYIPESALVTVDGVEGVYIFKDSTVRFRRIDVIWRGDGYCIAAEKSGRGEEYLDLYDILITAGKNLYDGKVY